MVWIILILVLLFLCSYCIIKNISKNKRELTSERPQNKKKGKIIIFITSIFIIIIIGIIILMVNKNKKSELQYNVKYAYGNSYITFYEDGTYSRNVNEIVKSKNYTYDKETKEIVCKEVQVIATLDTECEIHFEFINPNEIKLTSYKILDVKIIE